MLFIFYIQDVLQLKKNNSDAKGLKKVYLSSCKVPFILVPILMKLEFSPQIFEKKKIFKYQISRKSGQLEPSCSIRPDRRTDTMKLIVAYRNFAKVPKKFPSYAIFRI